MPFDGPIPALPVDETLETLERARERIARGWCQHAYYIEGRSWLPPFRRRIVAYCLGQSVGWADEAVASLLLVIRARWGDRYDLADWNDELGRTKEDVIEVLNVAIFLRRCDV